MTARVLVAGLLGAIAMFIWVAIAHMATPLGMIGISQIPKESPVLSAMDSSISNQSGLYFFPWVDMKAPDAMQKHAELTKTNPSGLLLYRPPGAAPNNMGPMMIGEFIKELVQMLIAAFIAAGLAASFATRLFAVSLIGLSAGLATNASYWIWYGFPLDYTVAQIVIEVAGAFAGGIAIAWWLGRSQTVVQVAAA